MSKRKLLKNIFSLSFAEFATKGISFFLNAYLARTIGVEGYGILANINAILAYLLMFVSLGFYVVGLRECATDSDDKFVKIQKYFSNITSIKLFCAILSLLFIIVYISLNDLDYLIFISLIIGSIQIIAYAIVVD